MSDRTTDPTLRKLLDTHSDVWFRKHHAPIQGRIQVYSTSPARVDVEPLVLLPAKPGHEPQSLILRDVPVIFPGGSTAGYTYPLTPGVDTVALIPQDADIDAYVASGTVGQLPNSPRRFDLSDCVAIPNNLRRPSDPLPSTAFASDGGVLRGLHYVGGSDASLFAALDTDQVPKNTLMGTWMTQVETVINSVAPGSVVPLSTTFTSIGNVQSTATKLKVK